MHMEKSRSLLESCYKLIQLPQQFWPFTITIKTVTIFETYKKIKTIKKIKILRQMRQLRHFLKFIQPLKHLL